MRRISAEDLTQLMREKLKKYGVDEEISSSCAKLMVENSLDGIYSHGINRFPKLISFLSKKYIKPQNKPSCICSFGAFEQWDGNLGMGTTNAKTCMDRTIEIARKYGIGCVALRNTNHWMRGGAYGLQAAEAGCIGICWTNTKPNMPAWGAKDCRIGNNPLIMCIPHKSGHIMVDAAMAQFSYGAIEEAKYACRLLPVHGGYDSDGNLSSDPVEIEKTGRVLPIGYWKGSGYSIVMDMIAACLANGNSTQELGKLGEDEFSMSQIFIAIDLKKSGGDPDEKINSIIEDLKGSIRVNEGQEILYPNEKATHTRIDNLQNGIPVEDKVWSQIQLL